MAAVADTQLVTISVNDIEIQVPKGEMIVESVKRLGLEIPIFCYHPRMKPVGMCRMCLVEVGTKMPDGTVRKMPKPQTACSLPASDGLVIYTDTTAIHKDRKGVLEFLLINHPLDCPICDRGGECPLQNNTLFYGPSTSRFVEMKRHAPKAFPLSKYVTLDLERCIQCGRCVRFTEEISGDAQLAFRFRGANMQPSTFQLTDFESKFSGNVIEICPVGALTSAKYRFRARPWDLQTKPGICTLCSNGCNVYVDYRKQEIARINGRTNEAINEEWTCDRGKFGHYEFNSEKRITSPLVRQADALVATEWSPAYAAILGAFRDGGDAVAALTAARNSNEDLYLLNVLFGAFGSNHVDFRFERHHRAGTMRVETKIADIETAPRVLVFGTSLADELPIVFLRLRKAWYKNGARVVVAHSSATDVDSFAHVVLRYAPGSEHALASALAGGDLEAASRETGIPAERIREAIEVLGEGAVTIASHGLFDAPRGADVAEILAGLPGQFNTYARTANGEGAALLGLGEGKSAHEILQGCVDGSIRALWLLGVDPFAAHPDRALVEAALERVDFLVVQDWRETEAMAYASVVLPMSAPTEMDGTYTNCERTVQKMDAILPAPGQSKPAWRACSELLIRLKPQTPYFNSDEVLAAIRKQIPSFPA